MYSVAWHRLIENTLFEEKVYVGYSLGESRWEKIANDRMRKKREGNETVYKEEEEELHKETVPCIFPSNQLKGLYKMFLPHRPNYHLSVFHNSSALASQSQPMK